MLVEQPLHSGQEARRAQVLVYLSEVYEHYQVNLLESGVTFDSLLQHTADLLIMHKMDRSFYASNENGLVALALSQEMMLAKSEEKLARLHQAFNLFTATDEKDPRYFSQSAYVREKFDTTFSPRSETRTKSIRRGGNDIPIKKPTYTALTKETTVNGMSVWQLAKDLMQGFNIPYERLFAISLAVLDPNEMKKLHTEAMTTNARILLKNTCSKEDIQHELLHALVGFNLERGYAGFFLRAVMEAFTEMQVENPYAYADQRMILETVFQKMPNENFRFALQESYLGDSKALKTMWRELIKIYGLRGVAYLGLLSPGTQTVLAKEMGEENAQVFMPPSEVLNFFQQQKAA